jgi:hypothetical protein
MRRAAGVLLIILGIFVVTWMIINDHFFLSLLIFWEIGFEQIVWGGLLVAGGVLCLRRGYWGLCLVSALLPLLMNIQAVVAMYLRGRFYMPWRTYMPWRNWILLSGALIAAIFILLRKAEWSESQAGLDSSANS